MLIYLKRTISIITLLALMWPGILFSQYNIQFEHLSVEDGLSQSKVSCSFQDHQGYMWFGTQDGLNRYDGFEFKTFYHEPGDSTSLSNNFIWEIFEDSQQNLWIGTFGGGLCLFDRELEQFKTFYPSLPSERNLNEWSVINLMEYPKGTLWVGTHLGLSLFDISRKEFIKQPPQLKSFRKEDLDHPISFFLINPDRLFLIAGEHVYLLNLNSGEVKPMFTDDIETAEFRKITRYQEGQFWMNTLKGIILVEYNPTVDSIRIVQEYDIGKHNQNNISDNIIHDMYQDENGFLWVATMKGLNVLDTKNKNASFVDYHHDKNLRGSLSSDFVFDLFEDDSKNLWIGTGNGVNRLSIMPTPFENLSFSNNQIGLCGTYVAGLREDDYGNLWIGGREGLSVIKDFAKSKDQWKISCYTPENRKDLTHKYVLGISKDRQGALWLSYRRDGFSRLVQNENEEWQLESFSDFIEPDYFKDNAVNTIYQDRAGDYWIASSGKHLIWFDPEQKIHKTYWSDLEDTTKLSHSYIYTILEDSKNNFWIGTAAGGLCKMDREHEKFTRYTQDMNNPDAISHNMVPYLFEDSKHRLWVCTANGLNLMESEGKFKRFSRKDGLPNDFIYGMLEDANGQLWVSTNNGISCVIYEDGIFTARNFNPQNGLASTEHNQNSYYKTINNQLCFGGMDGLSIFNPDQIKPYPYTPKVVFTDLLLFNESVPIKKSEGDLSKFALPRVINETESLALKYNQNFLGFEFAALGFSQPDNNQYAYQMVGVDQGWVESGTRRLASYPNLKSGDYVFKVKAANHEGVWNENEKLISISIAPPPWKTWWAYLIYLGIISLAFYGIIWFRVQTVRQVEKAKEEERELFRKRSARDFHDEAGNQITKISLVTEIAKRKVDDHSELKDLLDQIGEDVQTLRLGMRDFIWVLDPGNDDLYETLLRLKEFANGIFEFSKIHFTTKGIEESLNIIPLNGNQRRHLLLIFKEAINNSLKYSSADHALFEVIQKDATIEIKFSDDGVGYDEEQEQMGNGLKNIRSRAEKMGVKYLLTAQKNKGSSVSLFLSTTQMGN